MTNQSHSFPESVDNLYSAALADANVSEAHRQRPPVCGAPALIWHIAVAPYERRDPQGASTPSDYNAKLSVWVDEINTTIKRLAALDPNATGVELTQDKEPRDGLMNVTRPISQFDIRWNGLKIQCLIEGHYDFVAFSFLVDLSSQGGASADSELASQLRESISAAQASEDGGKYSEAAKYLFDDFWMSLRDAALTNAGLSVDHNLLPGRPFAKFSGLILEEDVAEEASADDGARPDDRFDPPGDNDHNARAIIRARWPFVIQANAAADERDIVACGMLGKRAIYITAMGAMTAQTTPSSEPAQKTYADVRPVRYIFMVRRSPDRLQLGRLIEHINTMGTFRLMALKELSLFRQVGTSVRIYGHLVDAASEQFNALLIHQEDDFEKKDQPLFEMEYNAASGSPRNPLQYIRHTKNIQRLQNALCQIQSRINMDASRFTGGMAFRVSRSRYYVRSLKERIPDLEISTIPPYQSYLAFVRRRLFATFDYIDDIGERASRLAARLTRILDAIQSKALVDLTHNIEVLNEYNTKIYDLTSKQSAEERDQTTILFTITVFAFVGQLIFSLSWALSGKEANSAAIAYGIAGFLALLLFTYRKRRSEKLNEKDQQAKPKSVSSPPDLPRSQIDVDIRIPEQ
jgi:hypothetical protein